MQAMILAAGMGTRLLPLTRYIPKPLFPILNIPSVFRLISQLESCGFSRVLINTFHLADQFLDELGRITTSMEVISIREHVLLGTGGALRNAAPHMESGPVFLINSDVVTDVDFNALWEAHLNDGRLATLFIHNRVPWNNLMIRNGRLKAFNYSGPEALAFTGISVFEKALVDHIPEAVPSSLVDAIENAMKQGKQIRAARLDKTAGDYIWEDIGTVKGYLDAHERLLKKNEVRVEIAKSGQGITDGAIFHDWACMGKNVVVEPGCLLGRTVLWDNVHVRQGQDVRNSIVTPFGILREEESL